MIRIRIKTSRIRNTAFGADFLARGDGGGEEGGGWRRRGVGGGEEGGRRRGSHLKNVVVGVQVESADVDLDKVLAEEIVGKLLHLLRPGGGPHQHLQKMFLCYTINGVSKVRLMVKLCQQALRLKTIYFKF